MLRTLPTSLTGLIGNKVQISTVEAHAEYGLATFELVFSDGARLRADYWRLIKNCKERVSSFDHGQQYGLPAPIDAIKQLETELQGRTVTQATLDAETGDLRFEFLENVKLQIFGFSSYEAWEIRFPDGTGEYSNYTK